MKHISKDLDMKGIKSTEITNYTMDRLFKISVEDILDYDNTNNLFNNPPDGLARGYNIIRLSNIIAELYCWREVAKVHLKDKSYDDNDKRQFLGLIKELSQRIPRFYNLPDEWVIREYYEIN